MVRVGLDVLLFYGSLGLSAAAVVLFLFLMRRPPVKPRLPPSEGEGRGKGG